MLTTERKTTCRQCGAKNDPDAERCRTCTRPLKVGINPIEQAFNDELWSGPISAVEKKRAPFALILVVLVLAALAAGNYYVWGFGPDWTHRIEAEPKGATWRTFADNPAYKAQLPGTPIVDARPTAQGRATFVTVGVNTAWESVIDADTTTPDALAKGRRERFATIVIVDGGPGGDAATLATAWLNDAFAGVSVSDVTTGTSTTTDGATRTEVEATPTGYPTDSETAANSAGRVRALVISTPVRSIVVGAFFDRQVDPDLLPSVVGKLSLR